MVSSKVNLTMCFALNVNEVKWLTNFVSSFDFAFDNVRRTFVVQRPPKANVTSRNCGGRKVKMLIRLMLMILAKGCEGEISIGNLQAS